MSKLKFSRGWVSSSAADTQEVVAVAAAVVVVAAVAVVDAADEVGTADVDNFALVEYVSGPTSICSGWPRRTPSLIRRGRDRWSWTVTGFNWLLCH